PFPVPEELHLHTAVLVDEDLLAAGPDDQRRLHAVHDGAGRAASGAECDGGVDALEVALVAIVALVAAGVALPGGVPARRQDVAAIERVGDVLAGRLQAELEAGRERARVAVAAEEHAGCVLLLLPDAREGVDAIAAGGPGRIVVAFVPARVLAGGRGEEIDCRRLEVVIGERGPAGAGLLLAREPGDDGVRGDGLLLPKAYPVEHRARLAGARRISRHERVLPGLMLEEVEDALLLE